MSKKIYIDKELIESLIKEYEGSSDEFIKGKLSQLKGILAHSTEIDTDQSIEDRAKKYLEQKGIKNYILNKEELCEHWTTPTDLIIYGATEQDLISKAREGEFAEWIAENDYIRSTNGLWYYKSDGEIEKGITTKELFIKFITEIKNESR